VKRLTKAIAYPTIPIVFLGGINPNRKPLYDTMGLAVTSLDNTTRTETTVELVEEQAEKITFHLNGKKITGKRGEQILTIIETFLSLANINKSIIIRSSNYNIFSGSSDSGLAALLTAMNDLLGLNFSQDELLNYAMKGSESAGRSLYGGLTLTQIKEDISVSQLASDQQLIPLKLFSIPFYYKSRISADEIHAAIVTNPKFSDRVKKIPYWINKIREAIKTNDFLTILKNAEENIQNAHELLEGVGIHVRKPEIMNLCDDVINLREKGISAYYLIGGGNLVTIATIDKFSTKVANHLIDKKWIYHESKVAGPPKIISSEK
jgi:mevalonate-3-kinase